MDPRVGANETRKVKVAGISPGRLQKEPKPPGPSAIELAKPRGASKSTKTPTQASEPKPSKEGTLIPSVTQSSQNRHPVLGHPTAPKPQKSQATEHSRVHKHDSSVNGAPRIDNEEKPTAPHELPAPIKRNLQMKQMKGQDSQPVQHRVPQTVAKASKVSQSRTSSAQNTQQIIPPPLNLAKPTVTPIVNPVKLQHSASNPKTALPAGLNASVVQNNASISQVLHISSDLPQPKKQAHPKRPMQQHHQQDPPPKASAKRVTTSIADQSQRARVSLQVRADSSGITSGRPRDGQAGIVSSSSCLPPSHHISGKGALGASLSLSSFQNPSQMVLAAVCSRQIQAASGTQGYSIGCAEKNCLQS